MHWGFSLQASGFWISYILTKRKHCNLTVLPADSKKPVCGMFAVSRFFVQSPKNDRRLQKIGNESERMPYRSSFGLDERQNPNEALYFFEKADFFCGTS